MTRRKTDAEFKAEVKALVGDEYLILSKYITSKIKVKFKHTKCGNIFEMKPNGFLNGSRCPKCMQQQAHDTRKKTDAEFKSEVKALVGDEYLVLDKYVNTHTKLRFKHKKCNLVSLIEPNSFLHGVRCSKCSYKQMGLRKRKTSQEFKKEFYDNTNQDYILASPYKTATSKILVLHLKCGYLYQTTPNQFLNGRRCPYCAELEKGLWNLLSDTEVQKRILRLGHGDYVPISKYNGCKHKILILHKICKHKYFTDPNNFFRGKRCPFCNQSKGEKIIEKYLKSKTINFKAQFRIKKCRDKRSMPFDFAVFNKDKSINCLIEYQGFQHFIDPFLWRKENGPFNLQSILDTQKHDAMKLQYCKDHGIKLIRINHPQTDSKSNSIEFIERLVNRTLDKELKVS